MQFAKAVSCFVDRLEGRLALSFDDGPYVGRTEHVLDTLAKARVPCTFYVTGVRAEEHPELVRSIAAAGHEVAQHSWDHPNLANYDDDFVIDQLERTNETLAGILDLPGHSPFDPRMGVPITTQTTPTGSASVRYSGPAACTFACGRLTHGIGSTPIGLGRSSAGLSLSSIGWVVAWC